MRTPVDKVPDGSGVTVKVADTVPVFLSGVLAPISVPVKVPTKGNEMYQPGLLPLKIVSVEMLPV